MDVFSEQLAGRLPLASATLELFDFAFDKPLIDGIYAEHRGRCYTDVLEFPRLLTLVRDGLLQHGGSGHRLFTELEREGLLVSRPGRGIYVAQPRNDLTRAARDRRLVEQLDRWLTEAVHLGYAADEVLRLVAKRVGDFQWQAGGAA